MEADHVAYGLQLVLWYLNDDNQIIRHACRYENEKCTDNTNGGTGFKATSGLTAVRLGSLGDRVYYVNEDRFLVEKRGDEVMQLDAKKAAKGSLVSATVPANTTDALLFYVDEDMSLSSLKWDGSKWSKGMQP